MILIKQINTDKNTEHKTKISNKYIYEMLDIHIFRRNLKKYIEHPKHSACYTVHYGKPFSSLIRNTTFPISLLKI